MSEIKFYYPEVGLDEEKTAEAHYKDLRYYMQDENIPAIEKIGEICQMMNMPFEAQMCQFAKESVEVDKSNKMPYNTGNLKADMAEALNERGYFRDEFEYDTPNGNTNVVFEARMEADSKSIDDARVTAIVQEFREEDGEIKESFGSGSVSFGEFKKKPPFGFDVNHGSIESFVNEISFYAFESNSWKPEKEEKEKGKSKDKFADRSL